MDLNPISNLAEYGLTGICLALIILFGFGTREILGFMKNHIKHSTEATQQLTDTIRELKEFLMHRNGK